MMIEEMLRCYTFEGECEDTEGIPCGASKCDDLVSFSDFLSAIPDLKFFPRIPGGLDGSTFSGKFFTWVLCPRSCGRCGWKRLSGPRYEPCDAGWSYADGECFKYDYGGPGRRHPELTANWFEAESACQAEGAHLATVETKAHEHLVFQLVKQRPDEVSPSGLSAWVGKPSGHDGSVHCTNQLWGGGETLDLGLAGPSEIRRAWVCSKPSQFRVVKEGFCQDFGLVPVSDMAMCSEVSKALFGMDRITLQLHKADWPFGCFKQTGQGTLRFSTHPDGRSVRAGNSSKTHLICRHTNVTPTSASDPEPEPELPADVWVSPQTMAVATSLGGARLTLMLALGIFPVLLLGVPAAAAQVAPALRKLRSAGRKRAQHATRDDDGLGEAMCMRFRELRCSVARGTAALLTVFHLFELLRLSLVEDSVCSSGGTDHDVAFRSGLAAVHIANLWVATAFLAACAFHRHAQWMPHLRLPFVLAVAALELVEVALKGEQALLVESRFYRQLLWRGPASPSGLPSP